MYSEVNITPLLMDEILTICMLLNRSPRNNLKKILFSGKPKITARADHSSWELKCVLLVQTRLEVHSAQLTPKSGELYTLPVKTQLLVETPVMIEKFPLIKKSVIKVANIIKHNKFSKLLNQMLKHKVL